MVYEFYKCFWNINSERKSDKVMNTQEYMDQTEQYVLPDTVNYIGMAAFAYNDSLKTINLPEGLEWIGERAFTGCKSLGRVDLPAGLSGLGSRAFSDCGTLTVLAPASMTTIADDAFNGTDVTLLVEHRSAAETFARDKGLKYRVIGDILQLPGSTQTIGAQAFANGRFEGVIVPEGAKTIGSQAFAGCAGLAWIDIPASVTSIASDAFSGLTALKIIAPANSAAARFAQDKGFTWVEAG